MLYTCCTWTCNRNVIASKGYMHCCFQVQILGRIERCKRIKKIKSGVALWFIDLEYVHVLNFHSDCQCFILCGIISEVIMTCFSYALLVQIKIYNWTWLSVCNCRHSSNAIGNTDCTRQHLINVDNTQYGPVGEGTGGKGLELMSTCLHHAFTTNLPSLLF